MVDLVQFRWRLAEVLAWVDYRVPINDPWSDLRTPALQYPGIDPDKGYVRYLDDDPGIVDWVAEQRAQLLQRAACYPAVPLADLERGKLLLYFQGREDADGAAYEASKGFLDGADAPPWDTWLWYAPEETTLNAPHENGAGWDIYLISWVPDEFVNLVDAAIPVTMMGSLMWADDPAADSLFLQRLRSAGLLR